MDSVTNKPFFATVEVLQVLLFSVEVEAPDKESAIALVKEAMATDAKDSEGLHRLNLSTGAVPALIQCEAILDEEVNIKTVSALPPEDSMLPLALIGASVEDDECVLQNGFVF